MNDITVFIDALIDLNPKDDLVIDKKCFYKNNNIDKIVKKYDFSNVGKNKLYLFALYILKFNNTTLQKRSELYNNVNIDLLFNNLKIIKKEYIDYFGCLFCRYMNYELKCNDLFLFLEILSKLKIKYLYFMWKIEHNNEYYTGEEYGKDLCKNGLAEKLEFYIGDMEYRLTKKGKEFFNNIYIEPTNKEKEFYSKKINIKKMSTLSPVLEHKRYYEEIMNEIGTDNIHIKVSRLYDKNFKIFFEEYNVLIKYAIAKYGNNCSLKFCGRDTSNIIKYDGFIIFGNTEEKIEITGPFYTKEEKKTIKELNKVGFTCHKCSRYEDPQKYIESIVKDAVEKKNAKESYDNTITLVVMFDDFSYLFSEQITDENYINSLFENLKDNNYKFKNINILIDKYESNKIVIEPRIITIK